MRRRSTGPSLVPLELDGAGHAGERVTKQPTSPKVPRAGHRSQGSADSFGGFVDSTNTDQLDEPDKGNPDTFIDDDDEEWQDADLISGFSPLSPRPTPSTHLSNSAQRQGDATTTDALREQQLGELDWTAWDTPQNSTPRREASSSMHNSVTNPMDDIASAYQRINLASIDRKPSPPIIDLREMSKKLDQQKALRASGLHADDLRFFESFDNDPRSVMANSRTDSHNKENKLDDEQLRSMHEAQASPLRIAGSNQAVHTDYFGDDIESSEADQRNRKEPVALEDSTAVSPSRARPGRTGSWTEAAGSWAGSLRKTIGTLREHLPSTRDLYIPEDEAGSSKSPSRAQSPAIQTTSTTKADYDKSDHSTIDSSTAHSPEHKIHSRKLADAGQYSQGTPFSNHADSGISPTFVASPPARQAGRLSPGALHGTAGHHSTLPVTGAPGFDPNGRRNWNTGSWSMTSQEELERRNKPIPVSLKGRREETQDVVTNTLAASLTARLPKRHQLGKTWKLLYSSDQHGISLQTLYSKVQLGLDLDRQGGGGRVSLSSAGLANAEGWLRGASEATKAAVTGTGVKRVGGGLSLSDAGLVLAIKDDDEHVFGAFVNEHLRPQSTYYGNGECFLWKQTDRGDLKTFPWTGRNDYMILTEAHYLSFGGGEGKYGLWLDGKLEHGVSSACPAFDNEILCDGIDAARLPNSQPVAAEGRFECITLEVWACGID